MKRGKWAVLSVLAAAMCPIAVACADNTKPEHVHNYDGSQWVITTMPTETTGGVASRDCVDNDYTDTKVLPNLKDTSFWTVDDDKSTPAGHGTPGKTVYTSEYGDVEVTIPAESHTYGGWNITLDPTWDTEGSATRVCTEDQHPDTVTVEKLSDASVWTKDAENSVAPDCTAAGKDVYKSKYGTVEIVIHSPGHSPTGGWTVTQEPTATTGGKSTSACANCDDIIEKDLPSFEDSEFWTHTHAAADYNHGTQDTYTSDFGTVVKEANDKIAAPYDNKTYYGICFDIEKAGGNPVDSYGSNMSITLDAKGTGISSNFLFGGSGYTFHIRMDDFSKGLITLETSKGEEHNETAAYLDTASGMYVRIDDNNVWAFTPFETDTEGAPYKTTKASHWTVDNKTAIVATYTSPASNDSKAYNIFVYGNKVYFGVKFASDKAGTSPLAAESCYNAQHVYVFDKDDEQIAAFAYDGEKMAETDGFEGAYDGTLDGESVTLNVSGHGAFTGNKTGTYTVAASGASYTLDAYIDGKYFEITLTDGGFTAEKPMVKVTLESDYDTATVGDPEKTVNKNIVMPLPELSDAAQHFGGWFFDAACTQPVPAQFKPTENVTLHAKWAQKVTITLHIDDNDERIVHLGVGDIVGTVLPELGVDGVDVANNRYFVGWYTDAACQNPLRTNGAVSAAQNGSTLYVKWEVLPAYYGEYEGKRLLSGSSTTYSAQITIDEYGSITGSIFTGDSNEKGISGKVSNFDPTTGHVTYSSGSAVGHMWIDTVSGLLVVPDASDKVQIDLYPFVLTKDGSEVGSVESFGFHNGSPSGNYTKLISYGNGKLAFIYNDRVYGDVKVTDASGTNITTPSEANESKTLIVKDRSNNEVVAFGTTAEKFTDGKDVDGNAAVLRVLDGLQGVYTYNGVQYTLDGMGNIAWEGSEWAVYTSTGDGKYDVYERNRLKAVAPSTGDDVGSGDWEEEGDWGDVGDDDDTTVTYVYSYTNKAYYTMTVSNGAITEFDKPMITVTYNIGTDYTNVGTNTTSSAEYNKNIPAQLVSPEVSATHKFDGWYTDAACTTPVTLTDGKYMTTENIPLYSKWALFDKLHVYYVVGEAAPVLHATKPYAPADTIDLSDCVNPGYAVVGVYSDAACTQEFTEISIQEDTDVYIKWRVKQAYENVYKGVYISSNSYMATNANYSINEINSSNELIAFSDVGGETSTGLPFASCTTSCSDPYKQVVTITFNKESKEMMFNVNRDAKWDHSKVNANYYGVFDETNKIILVYYAKESKTLSGGIGLFLPKNYTIKTGEVISGWGNYSPVYVFDYIDASSNTHTIYIDTANNSYMLDCVVKDENGNVIAAKDVRNKKYIEIYDNKNPSNPPIKLVYKNSNFVTPGLENGTYTCSGKDDIFLNGGGAFTWGEKTGTYEAISGQSDKWYLKSGSERYTMTVSGNTYTVAEEKVTITFVTAHGTAPESVIRWKGEGYNVSTAPTLTATGYKFRYWYETNESTQAYWVYPNTDITLTAKWDPQVTVTYHYNDDGAHADAVDDEIIYAGDSIKNLNAVEFKFGTKAFAGWFTKDGTSDGDWGTELKAGATISADTDLYAKWVEPSVLTGTWKVINNNWSGVSDYNNTEVVIDPTGLVTKGSSSHINSGFTVTEPDSDGVMQVKDGNYTYFAYYDASNNVFAFNKGYRSSTTELGTTPMIVINVASADVEVKAVAWSGSSDRETRLVSITVDGTTKYILIYNNKVYYDVTVAIKDANGASVNSLDAIKQLGSEVTVTRDADLNVTLFGTGKESGYAIFAVADDTRGTYTLSGGTDTVVYSGANFLKIGGEWYSAVKVGGDDSSTYSVTTDSECLEYTFDVTAKTYTVNKPMVSLNFSANIGTLSFTSLNANKNIGVALPTVDSEHVLLGWYYDEAYTNPVTLSDGKFVPTEGCTLYAKCDALGNYTLAPVSGNEYTFAYQSDGWWESNSQGQDRTNAQICITATGGTVVVEVTYYSHGESNYDYLTTSATGTVHGEMINAKGKQNKKTSPKTAKFVLEDGATLTFDYCKDGSGDGGTTDTAGLQLTINGVVVTELKTA